MIRQIGLADSGLSHVSRAIRWIRGSREYRRLFGAPPGHDVARLRAGTHPDNARHLP
jgi:hypothetical protein